MSLPQNIRAVKPHSADLLILTGGVRRPSAQRAPLWGPQLVLPVQDVILQALRQRQETHEGEGAQAQSAEASADLQAAEMLQRTGVL